jgi:hypothetical protein
MTETNRQYSEIFCKHVIRVNFSREEVMMHSFSLYPMDYQPIYGKTYFFPYYKVNSITTEVAFDDYTFVTIVNNIVRFYMSDYPLLIKN